MMTIDDNYLRSCAQFDPAMTVEEYFSAVERYMRMIWDDSLFPEKELREKQSMICDAYNTRIPIAETADKVIDQIQDELENPELEALLELIVRRETEGTKANTKPRKKKEA